MAKDIKFELTSETVVNTWGVTLFRIKATMDIKSRGVKKGEKGGFVESTHLENGNARVYGNAWVYGDAQVYGNAWVSGDAQVSGNARVYGNAWVYGDAQVYGNAWVSGDAQVSGNARVYGEKAYTKGWFIGGDDTGKITNVTDQMGTDYWQAQYVLGNYEINDVEPVETKTDTINIGGKEFEVTDELTDALKNLKEVK